MVPTRHINNFKTYNIPLTFPVLLGSSASVNLDQVAANKAGAAGDQVAANATTRVVMGVSPVGLAFAAQIPRDIHSSEPEAWFIWWALLAPSGRLYKQY